MAVIAGARKLIQYIYQVLSQQRPFDESFEMGYAEQLKKNHMPKIRKITENFKQFHCP
ncbi:MAG: hypothetical protein ACTSRI_03455 [Promethearchaeota archaeon]